MKIIADKTLSYCWKILDQLETGQKIIVKDYAPNNPNLFIDCCKEYFDTHRTLKFSNDYSEIGKVERIKTFAEINEQYKFYLDISKK